MASLVSDFIINPVLRQARRISEISRPTSAQFGADGERTLKSLERAPEDPQFELAQDLGSIETTIVPLQPGPQPADDGSLTLNSPQLITRALPIIGLIEPDQVSTLRQPVSQNTNLPVRRYEEESDYESIEFSRCPSPAMEQEIENMSHQITEVDDRELPEDDGMAEMRSKIRQVQGLNAPLLEKGKLLHEILMKSHLTIKANIPISTDDTADSEGRRVEKKLAVGTNTGGININNPLASLKFWNTNNNKQEDATEETFTLTERDLEPTFHPVDKELGCKHYHRNVKLQCAACNKWYACRLCHDNVEDHELPRRKTKNMLCMLCLCPQRASDTCVNCGVSAARYFCNICKLWENRPTKAIYHCNDCGICRKGHGLGEDFFHCKTCNACISTTIQSSHKCIERATDCNCPICEDYLFTSRKSVVFMNCGHSIHRSCHERYLANGCYKCPLCNKAILNTETLFRTIDLAIEQQPMPEEYAKTKAVTLCHECSTRTTVPYHWLGLKCGLCQSYNTALIETINHPSASVGVQNQNGGGSNSRSLPPTTPADATLRSDQMLFPRSEGDALQRLGAMEAHRQAQIFGDMNAEDGTEGPNGYMDLQTITGSEATFSTALPLRPARPRTFSHPPIQELDVDSVERFLQQFDHEVGPDILNLWDGNSGSEGVGALTRNALATLQQALQNNILDGEDLTGVAAMTRNAFNSLQQALQTRLEGNIDGEGVMALTRNALTSLHQAIHGNVVDSDNEEGQEEGEEEEEDSDDQSSVAEDFEEPENEIVLLGHR